MGKRKKIFILGVNGFIGNALAEKILQNGGYDVSGIDTKSHNIERLFAYKEFRFKKGDIRYLRNWIKREVARNDMIIPLTALVTPIEYIRRPLSVFEIDFEENLKVVRYCVEYKKS
jgi:UDP-4-amino-4-deoxy-L-arabinose formyltransferase/UDP-glucuronic acid dehydrogenase (UDP-4-keto-hexauronic acid decarboxylating)